MRNNIFPSLKAFFILTILAGVFYPLLITILAQLLFPHQANGSLIVKNGTIIGSELIGQKFSSVRYFWSRPSVIDYNPMPSGASNAGPTSKALSDSVKERRKRFVEANALVPTTPIPPEMLFASGSGVDPHISPEAVLLQVHRVAQARGFDGRQINALQALIQRMTEPPQFNLLGQPCVNILKLNLALDEMQ